MLRVALLGLIALGLAGFGGIAWVLLPNRDVAVAATAKPVTVAVLTVTRAIRLGALLKPEDIVSREIDVQTLPPGHALDQGDTARTLVGGMARRSMLPGDVIRLPLDVLRATDHGFLAAVLTPGTRAVTIGIDAVSGTAGLIWPGDRVDILLTQFPTDQNQDVVRRISAETVLRDVRVIAIDQQLVQGAGRDAQDQKPARTITLEVSPPNAETVQVATRLGQLSLLVRSAEAGPGGGNGPGITYSSDVSNAAQQPRPKPSSIRVFTGSAEGKEFKF